MPPHKPPWADRPDAPTEGPHDLTLAALPGCDWLFTSAAEPMLIVEAVTGKIIEANPPAAMLFHSTPAGLVGAPLPGIFETASATTIEACLAIAEVVGNAETLGVQARDGGMELRARLSLLRTPPGAYFLVRLTSEAFCTPDDARSRTESIVFQAIDAARQGFLITDRRFLIDYANREFIDMIDLETPGGLCGGSLLRWLALGDRDLAQLRLQLSQRQAVSRLTANLVPHRGDPRRVAVWAVAVPAGIDTAWGFSIGELPHLN